MHVGFLARARAGRERALLAFDLAQARHQLAHHRLAEARADAADMDQLLVLAMSAMHADQQRAQPLALAGPAADHHLVAGPALGLDPAADAARAIGRIELLGDDAFQVHATRRFQHRVARRLEMLDILQARMLALEPVEQLLQARLAIAQGQGAQILAVGEQQIEGKEDQLLRLPFGQGRLQRREVGRAMGIERHRLAIDHAVRQLRRLLGDRRELLRPVEALARAQPGLAVLDAQLQAIAVELDLVRPSGLRGRALDQLAELRFDEGRHLADLAWLRLAFGEGRLVAAALLVALPDRTGRSPLAGHERRRRPSFADRDLVQGAAPTPLTSHSPRGRRPRRPRGPPRRDA